MHLVPLGDGPNKMNITIDRVLCDAQPGERLIDVINRVGRPAPPGLLPSAARPDPDLRHLHGRSERQARPRLRHDRGRRDERVTTNSPRATAAQREAFDRILGNHLLYCTVCDNNNGNCTVHNTTKTAGRRAPADPVQAQAVRGRQVPIRSIATIPISAFSAAAASRPARTSR